MRESGRIIVASAGLAAEAALVRALTARGSGFTVLRRMSDVVELVGVGTTMQADAVVLSPRFPRLSRDVVARLSGLGLTCIAVVDRGDEQAERIAAQWGLPVAVVAPDQGHIAAGIATAMRATERPPDHDDPGRPASLIAVLGTAGAPGCTTVAVNLAAELGATGRRVCVIDLDPVAPAVAFVLGVPIEPSGLAGALLLAQQGRLEARTLTGCTVAAAGLTVLTGVPGDRVPHTSGFAELLHAVRFGFDAVVVDCGMAQTCRHRFDGEVLACATGVAFVAAPTALGIRRFVDEWPLIRDDIAGRDAVVLWNRVSTEGALGRNPMARLREVVALVGGPASVTGLPRDEAASRIMDRRPGPLTVVMPRGALRSAFTDLAAAFPPGQNRTPRHTGTRGSA